MTDRIDSLPESQDPISPEEMNIMREVFQATQSSVDDAKSILLYGIAFVVLNLPIVDNLIKGTINTTSTILVITIKTVIFLIVVWVLKLFGF